MNLGVKPWKNLPDWVKANRFFKKDLVNGGPMVETNPEHANLVSSQVFYDEQKLTAYHTPIIDLDIPAQLIPSTTPGHSHLFIDKLLTDEQYDKLLRVLVEVGIVQKGILDLQWETDKMTCARLPGIIKEVNSLSSGGKISASTETFETSSGYPKVHHPKPMNGDSVLTKELLDKATINVIQGAKYSLSPNQVAATKNVSYLSGEEKKNFEVYATLNKAYLEVIEGLSKIASDTGQDFMMLFDAYQKLASEVEKSSTPEPHESPF